MVDKLIKKLTIPHLKDCINNFENILDILDMEETDEIEKYNRLISDTYGFIKKLESHLCISSNI